MRDPRVLLVDEESVGLLRQVLEFYQEEREQAYKDFLLVMTHKDSNALWDKARKLRDDLLEHNFIVFLGTSSHDKGRYVLEMRVGW